MYCKNCGKKLPDDAAFCTECGAAVKTSKNLRNNFEGTIMSPTVESSAQKTDVIKDNKLRDERGGNGKLSENSFIVKASENPSPDEKTMVIKKGGGHDSVQEFGSGPVPNPAFVTDDPDNKLLSDKNTSQAKIILAVCVAVLLAAVLALYLLISAGVGVLSDDNSYPSEAPERGFDMLEDDSYMNPQLESSRTQTIIWPDYDCLCPFTADVSSDYDYYIYLRYIGEPYESYDERSSMLSDPEISDVSCYVKAGESISFDVPIGVYELYYACGDNWQGAEAFFGDEGIYLKSGDTLEFYSDDEYYQGVTVDLSSEDGGDMDVEYIEVHDFPYLPF